MSNENVTAGPLVAEEGIWVSWIPTPDYCEQRYEMSGLGEAARVLETLVKAHDVGPLAGLATGRILLLKDGKEEVVFDLMEYTKKAAEEAAVLDGRSESIEEAVKRQASCFEPWVYEGRDALTWWLNDGVSSSHQWIDDFFAKPRDDVEAANGFAQGFFESPAHGCADPCAEQGCATLYRKVVIYETDGGRYSFTHGGVLFALPSLEKAMERIDEILTPLSGSSEFSEYRDGWDYRGIWVSEREGRIWRFSFQLDEDIFCCLRKQEVYDRIDFFLDN